ncbi:MAG: hypothetical protein II828_04685 [Clostridia bacterium]|nr:hypothetical protein [Clostridia bacterium]
MEFNVHQRESISSLSPSNEKVEMVRIVDKEQPRKKEDEFKIREYGTSITTATPPINKQESSPVNSASSYPVGEFNQGKQDRSQKVEMVRIVSQEEKEARKAALSSTGITTATPKYLVTENLVSSPASFNSTGEANQNQSARPHGREMVRIVSPEGRPVAERPSSVDRLKNNGRAILACNTAVNSATPFVFREGILYFQGAPKTNFYMQADSIAYFYDQESICVDKRLSMTFYVCENGNIIQHKLASISREKLEESSIIDKIPFARHFCEKRTELNDFFYKYVNYIINTFQGPVFKVFSRPGWKRELTDYITADGAIGHPELSVRSEGNVHIADRFPGMLYTEFCKMCATIQEAGKMQVILAYVLAGYLHSVFEDAGFPVKHALFIVGPRGSKKTSIAQCFTQLGDDSRTVKFNFTATESGIMFNLQHYADRVMLIDDLAPSMDTADKKRKEKMLESILRLCGDSGERVINTAFMKSGAEKIDYRVRGGIVITGEYFYGTGSESSIARAVVVSLERDSVDDALLAYFQRNPQILESLIFRLIKFVSWNYNLVLSTIRSTMEQYRASASSFHFSNARYVDYLGQYNAVSRILSELFISEGNALDRNSFSAEFHSAILGILTENEQMMRRQAPIDIVLCAILADINAGHLAQWGSPFTEEVKIIRGEDAFFFRQMDLPGIVALYCRTNNLPSLSLSSTELGRLLTDHGYCATVLEGGQKRRGKRYKEYGKERLMSIPIEKMNEFEKNVDC